MNNVDLGSFTMCLNIKNLSESIAFYRLLGFRMVEDQSEQNWAVLKHNDLVLSLFEGHIDNNLINFRGGDIEDISQKLVLQGITLNKPATREEDGSWSTEILDPDGNVIYLNTFPSERELYLQGKSVFED